MREMGKAMMGTGEAKGDRRAILAAEAAISNPLLDDVSMRGARGLLISITGGPDLTLYEVDEAATRIREEVDPEANIILGATFDESLEGVMRVSVVATGLAAEALAKGKTDEVEEEKPQVFGFTGKQSTGLPVKKPVLQAAPMAARPAPQPVVQQPVAQPVQAAPSYVEDDIESEPEPVRPAATMAPPLQPMQQRPAQAQPRMPSIDQFPPHVQTQIERQQAQVASIAQHAERKKPGLFQRLASVGLGRKEDTQPSQREPVISVQPAPQRPAQPQLRQPPVQHAPQPVQQVPENTLDDDQLEIPAFLRRQAN
jgi:cell division protein FtsZ